MTAQLTHIEQELKQYENPEKAQLLERFFKTGKGEYAAGDKFLGLTVPQVRTIAKKYKNASIETIDALLKSPLHEKRLLALIMLVNQYKTSKDTKIHQYIYKYYLNNTKYINNWDLVDLSAHHIVGPFLEDKDKKVLEDLAHSTSIWERRIAVLSTFHYIAKGNSTEALRIAELLLKDKHHLIHKAVGWMLREIGKRCSKQTLKEFLNKHAHEMPRTMVRYAIEHFSENERKEYMQKRI